MDFHRFAVVLGVAFLEWVFACQDMHGCLETRFGVRFSHGVACHLQGFQQQTLTRPRDVRKEPVLNGIIL